MSNSSSRRELSSRSKKPVKLMGKLEKLVAAYATAATAAGIGTLAFGHVAYAEIIYTPANERAFRLSVDLNGDGIADFYFPGDCSSGGSTSGRWYGCYLSVSPATHDAIWQTPVGVTPLPSDILVGSPGKFGARAPIISNYRSSFRGQHRSGTNGPWKNLSGYYLGVQFVDTEGQTHYGWARLSVTTPVDTILTGYAYETTPNMPILMGKEFGGGPQAGLPKTDDASGKNSGTLGQLARGSR